MFSRLPNELFRHFKRRERITIRFVRVRPTCYAVVSTCRESRIDATSHSDPARDVTVNTSIGGTCSRQTLMFLFGSASLVNDTRVFLSRRHKHYIKGMCRGIVTSPRRWKNIVCIQLKGEKFIIHLIKPHSYDIVKSTFNKTSFWLLIKFVTRCYFRTHSFRSHDLLLFIYSRNRGLKSMRARRLIFRCSESDVRCTRAHAHYRDATTKIHASGRAVLRRRSVSVGWPVTAKSHFAQTSPVWPREVARAGTPFESRGSEFRSYLR